MNANDKLKKWINHNYLTKGDGRMITDKTKWDDKDYYYGNFEDIMYDKITEGIDLTEEDLKDLACGFPFYEIEKDRDSFTVDTQSIVKLRGKYFAINWQQGLEDFEDSKFDAQPYEVKKINQMTTTWIPIG